MCVWVALYFRQIFLIYYIIISKNYFELNNIQLLKSIHLLFIYFMSSLTIFHQQEMLDDVEMTVERHINQRFEVNLTICNKKQQHKMASFILIDLFM